MAGATPFGPFAKNERRLPNRRRVSRSTCIMGTLPTGQGTASVSASRSPGGAGTVRAPTGARGGAAIGANVPSGRRSPG